jgi:hypothetical protein
MISNIARRVRKRLQALEAGRREAQQTDRLADQGDTWPAAQWNREYRHWQRLYRIACGRCPWTPMIEETGHA